MQTEMIQAFVERGYAVVRAAVSEERCREFEGALEPVLRAAAAPRPGEADGGGRAAHGTRNLLARSESIRELAAGGGLQELASRVLGAPAQPVKAIYFDKLPSANWVVPWHQDLTIAVQRQAPVPGFVNWTRKAGVVHVQPPAEVLESIVTLRIHLDDCPAENGALRVVPGSHRAGRLDEVRTAKLRQERGEVVCETRRGDVLVMSPLLLHSSPRAARPTHRRIVHVEYSSKSLPEPLRWHG